MDTRFLRNNWLLKEKDHSQDPTFRTGITYLIEIVEPALESFLKDHNLIKFLNSIYKFDRWAFGLNYKPPQKSNWLNTGQNKAYPYITELYWRAIFQVICDNLNKKVGKDVFKLIEGNKMPNFRSNNMESYKATDTGIYIELGDIFPVIYCECKNGHVDKVPHEGIWGQGIRLKQTFPNALQMFVTDNNISMTKELPESYMNTGIDIQIQQRGEPGEKWRVRDIRENDAYYPLNSDTIKKVIDSIIELVGRKPISYWNKQIIALSEDSSYVGKINAQGYYIKPGLFD